jgi:hypothetical protein
MKIVDVQADERVPPREVTSFWTCIDYIFTIKAEFEGIIYSHEEIGKNNEEIRDRRVSELSTLFSDYGYTNPTKGISDINGK